VPTKSSNASGDFPGGKRFAFTVLDDTDVSTLENVRPVYRLLESLRMRTTKTVWPVGCPEGSNNFSSSETLEDPAYREFVVDLQRRGFEVTWHCATMETSTRDRTITALERFREILGQYPRVHANHAENRENVYWGHHRIDQPFLKSLMRRASNEPPDHYRGHDPRSPYWWGDLCTQHFRYVRNLTFDRLNLATINPSMPYKDPHRPHANLWFSGSDAEDAEEFAYLLRPEQQERLEDEGGFCIVATHFGKRFVKNGAVETAVENRLRELSHRPGWFVPVGKLLDFLAGRRSNYQLPESEWRAMQWQWAWDLAQRKLRRRSQRSRARRP